MKNKLSFCLAAVLLGSAFNAFGSDDDFRLSGIISAGDKHLALFEFPDKSHRLLRTGEKVAQYSILEITRQKVLIQMGDQGRWLELAYTASEATDVPEISGNLITQEIDVNETAHALNRLSVKLQHEPNIRLSEALAPVFALPKGVRITAVNDVPIDENNAKQGLKMLEKTVRQSDTMVRLSITNASGTDAIYLMPSGLPEPANVAGDQDLNP